MKVRFSRTATAISLGVSLWVSSVAALAGRKRSSPRPGSFSKHRGDRAINEFEHFYLGDELGGFAMTD